MSRFRAAQTHLLMTLVVLAASASGTTRVSADSSQARPGTLIDIPYFSQTPLLCGGAALAMVLRYWGDATTVPDDFQSLVDRAAGGITTSRLIDAARTRGWQAVASSASEAAPIDAVATHVRQGRPVLALIEERPGVDHYVVVVGVTATDMVVHDPAREPYRVLSHADFIRRWQTSSRWMLLVLPADANEREVGAVVPATASAPAGSLAGPPGTVSTPCDALVAQGVSAARTDQVAAERTLRSAVALCPDQAGGFRELAGLRFVQQRWGDSITFAEQAVARDDGDRHAWQLLATSRFLDDDRVAALQAWNVIGEPTVDSVTIDGLRRTPQPVVTALAGLRPGQRLTAGLFTRASRRLEEFPSASRASLTYAPVATGRVSVTAVVNERRMIPRGAVGWSTVAVDSVLSRRVRLHIAAPFSQGDLWLPSFTWPRERRRIALDAWVPAPSGLPGIIRVETFWERQSYARVDSASAVSEETRRRVGGSYSTWVSSPLRVEIGVAADRLDGRGYVAIQTGITSRLWRDHIAAHLRVERWLSTGSDRADHGSLDAVLDWRSATGDTSVRWIARAGGAMVSDDAPLALWPGAGTGDRSALIRGRRLVRDHVVSGEVFGRRLAFSSLERQQVVRRTPYGTIALAAFVDAAKAWDRIDSQHDSRVHVDVGPGVRLVQAGDTSQIRVDWGIGLRDGRMRVSAGYLAAWGRR